MPWSIPTDDELVLTTERLVLRPIEVRDAEALFPFTSDFELPRQMTWLAHDRVEQTREFATACVSERAVDTGYVWVAEEGGRPGGVIGLDGVFRGGPGARFDRAELGYWLGRPFRGRGLMTEAARTVVAFGFDRLALHKITAHAFVDNPASLRVLEKLGFTSVGTKREDVLKDGRWHDQHAFEMLAGELRPRA